MKKKYWHSYTIQVNKGTGYHIITLESNLLTPHRSEWNNALKEYPFGTDREQVDAGWYVFTGHVCFRS